MADLTTPILSLRCPGPRTVKIFPDSAAHPILGACDRLYYTDDNYVLVTKIDWMAPGHIPAIDTPARLPRGVGLTLLNHLASVASRPLQYRGPYPTAALFDTLAHCFTIDGDLQTERANFCQHFWQLATRGQATPPDVEFQPAPLTVSWPSETVCVYSRDGVPVRVFVGSCGFNKDPAQSVMQARIVENSQGYALQLVANETIVWDAGQLDAAADSFTAGTATPTANQAAPQPLSHNLASRLLAMAVAALPPQFQSIATKRLSPLAWADLGIETAMLTPQSLHLNKVLTTAYESTPAKLLNGLVDTLSTIASRVVIGMLSEDVDRAIDDLSRE